ncbi:hypothetical protein IRJ41_012996 [Triplophysa rosa]|uniref:Uncharacterized protein n=1 Tax=Triplophysa rosa TaxID=992332 RepID=A0A9W7WRC8_TRIRA|nr:hypothetical protein IRJ41_012996 [Triplophysa rosa]
MVERREQTPRIKFTARSDTTFALRIGSDKVHRSRSILRPAATVPAPALGFRLRRGHLGVPRYSSMST